MFYLQNSRSGAHESGMVFILAIVTLALLGVLGLAAHETAHLNSLIAANDRDSKSAFFLAEAGVNAGHEFLERAITAANSTFYDDGTSATNASLWGKQPAFNPDDYPVKWHRHGAAATHVRAGLIATGIVPGSAMQMASGYESTGRGAASGGTFATYLVRSHRQGLRGSAAEVDLGWWHINH